MERPLPGRKTLKIENGEVLEQLSLFSNRDLATPAPSETPLDPHAVDIEAETQDVETVRDVPQEGEDRKSEDAPTHWTNRDDYEERIANYIKPAVSGKR